MMPFWKFLPVHWAHEMAPMGLAIAAEIWGEDHPKEWNPLDWKGLHFPNRIGVAGGVDKNAEQGYHWQRLGAGFVEIGTVTPEPQEANPGKILGRDWSRKDLWNKMGFPNQGAREIRWALDRWHRDLKIPLFINLGKNRWTSDLDAAQDYQFVLQEFLPLVDGFVVNVSSPNTAGLRDLQKADALSTLCRTLVPLAQGKPVLVKLSPDLSEQALGESLRAAAGAGVSGFILTNTTLSRPENCEFPKEGGLSGQSLRSTSKMQLERTLRLLGPERKDLLIVSTGGIMSLEDVNERLNMGADLVQVYSALVFEGPRFFQKLHPTRRES